MELPQEVASQILDLIRAPPAGDPYGVLREFLITLYMLNDYQRFEALVSLPLYGDQKPSHLMNRMLALLPDDYKPDFILRGLFLRHLHIDVRSHLLREKVSDPRVLALKADKLYQSQVSPSSVNLLADAFGESLQVNLVSSHSEDFQLCQDSSLQAFSNSSSDNQISDSIGSLLVPQETW